MTMTASSALVTVRCPDHHRKLTNGLWNLYQTKHGKDSELGCGVQSIRAHGMVMQVFLSNDDYLPVEKDSGVVDRLLQSSEQVLVPTAEGCGKKRLLQSSVGERSEPVAKKKRLFIPGQTTTDDRSSYTIINPESLNVTYRCSKCLTMFSSKAGMQDHLKRFQATSKCDNLLELVLEFMYKGTLTLGQERLDDLQVTARMLNFQLLVDAVEEAKRCKPIDIVISRVEHTPDKSSVGPPVKNKPSSKPPPTIVKLRGKLLTKKPILSPTEVYKATRNGCKMSGSSVCNPDVTGSESDHSEWKGTSRKLRNINITAQRKHQPELVSKNMLLVKNDKKHNPSSLIFRCSKCLIRLRTDAMLMDHCKRHHPELSEPERDGMRNSRMRGNVNKRQNTEKQSTSLPRGSLHHNKTVSKELSCHKCDFVTEKKVLLQRHLAKHKLKRPVMSNCSLCDYKTSDTNRLSLHCKSVHLINISGKPLRILKCAKCEYATPTRGDLLRHVDCHHPEMIEVEGKYTLHECPLCNFKALTSVRLKVHKAHVHSVDDMNKPLPILKCAKCKYTTIIRYNLMTHTKYAHPELITGKLSHVERTCSLCNYKTYICNRMRVHKAIVHSVDVMDKPLPILKCTKCTYSTPVRSYLTRHTKEQHPEMISANKPNVFHKCSLCDFKTKFAFRLKLHNAVAHTSDGAQKIHAVMECTKCDYATSIRRDLLRHVKSNHPKLTAKLGKHHLQASRLL